MQSCAPPRPTWSSCVCALFLWYSTEQPLLPCKCKGVRTQRQLNQSILLKSGAGTFLIRGESREDLCTTHNLIHFECPDKSLQKASCKVAEEWPEPSFRPPLRHSHSEALAKVLNGYGEVQKYVREVHSRNRRALLLVSHMEFGERWQAAQAL